MILLAGVVLGIYVAWRVKHLGLYLALCDALGVTLGGVAGLAYTGNVVALVPLDHPLKGAICMLAVFLVVWMMFRTLARSFAADWAVEFGKPLDRFGSMAVAFGGTMVFVGMVATIALTSGLIHEKSGWLVEPLEEAAYIVFAACKFIAFFAGGPATPPPT